MSFQRVERFNNVSVVSSTVRTVSISGPWGNACFLRKHILDVFNGDF
jgi:hypothetical protein